MKRILALGIVALMISTSSHAGPHHYNPKHHHGHGHGHAGWVAPLVIGSVVGYAIAARPQVPNPPVIYPNSVPPAPWGYHYEYILDANCNCYRQVLVQN